MNNSTTVDQLNRHIYAGNTDAAIALLSSGVPLDEVGSSGRTPLMAAAFKGNMDVVRALIQSGANVSMQGRYGLTALHDAAFEGHSEIVDLLLKSGAIIDTCSEQNVTPLISAAAADEFDIVRLLLNHGADASIQDCIGATALDTAIEKGSDDKIVELLKSWSRDRNII